jgi:hypothetical protein
VVNDLRLQNDFGYVLRTLPSFGATQEFRVTSFDFNRTERGKV